MWHRSVVLGFLALPTVATAQQWGDSAARALAIRATAARSAVGADSSLASYSARARGIVTFEAELASGPLVGPRLVKADELVVEVYWERPDRSKQVILAWRDSTFLPTDLDYHRDHLGIVSNDFGDPIQIGDGDEVEDVIHPLSPRGLDLYEFRVRDTVRIAAGGERPLVLVALEFRPLDRSRPAAIGTLFLDAQQAAVVRSDLSFTPAAYRDRDLEDITVRLERALIEGHWLPYLQTIEIRRRSAVLDFPLRGVIRGRWEIGDHRVNDSIPARARSGPSIGGLLRPTPSEWLTPLSRVVDSASGAENADLEQVRRSAAALVRRRLLDGLPGVQPGMSRLSDFLRVTRVEGLRIGAGVTLRGGPIDVVRLQGGVATGDGRLTGALHASRMIGSVRVGVRASHLVEDIGTPAASGLVNSLAAQEGGRDLGDYALIGQVGIEARGPIGRRWVGTALVAREWAGSVRTVATPARGGYRSNPALGGPALWFGRLGIEGGSSSGMPKGWHFETMIELGTGAGGTYGTWLGTGHGEIPVGSGVIEVRGAAAVMTSFAPIRRTMPWGGVGTVPGEAFRGYGGRRSGWIATGWLARVPGPRIGLGGLGRLGGSMLIGPILAGGVADGGPPGSWADSRGLRPSVGFAAEILDRTVRVEVGRRLRGRGAMTLSIDLTRSWWPIL